MNNEFGNSKIEQVYDDFVHSKGNYDDLMENALKDMGDAVRGVKNRRDGFSVSDDIAALMEEHGDKFGKALSSASAADREKWAPQLAEILTAATDMNPDNTESIIKSAFELEKAYHGADSGVLLNVAEKATFRHPEHLEEIVAVTDKHLQNYDAQSDKDASTYKAFYKVYTNAVRKTRKAEMREKASTVANDIFGKIEIVKGNVTVDKLLQRVKDNPADETTQDAFERGLDMLLTTKPKEGAKDVLNNLKAITKIENPEDRAFVYTVVMTSLERHVDGDDAKASAVFKALDTMMQAEKDPEVRKSAVVSAMGSIQHGMVDETGALTVIAGGKEKETFRTLKRMAESYGNYAGFKDLLANTAEKYQKSPAVTEELKAAMMKALDYEERNNVETDDSSRSQFEKDVLAQKRVRDNKIRLDTQIYALLNIPHKTNKYTRDPSKPQMPVKSDMRKVVNLLSQYRKIDDDYLVTAIFSKMDKEKFTNVDDAILDSFERAAPRIKGSDEIKAKLTAMRAKMHTQGIQAKKAQEMPKWHEKSETKPNQRISFSVKDLPDTSYGK
ncbi:MAG: hypothetical protein IJ770_03910 [Alphaproteobacteria bacterium]|nr:hypothetical protein [Alphaproteobacteria bacterium]